jgi:hypothetical protein
MWTLEYANGFLYDIFPGVCRFSSQKCAQRYNANTGIPVDRWNYSGPYELYYYLTHDGSKFWGLTNYNCNGSNCQAVVEYSATGAVLNARTGSDDGSSTYDDLVFGGGYFWAAINGPEEGAHQIVKLDPAFTVVETYRVRDSRQFGYTQYANELALHLVYMNDRLWVVDRSGNFYRTSLQ